MSKINKVLVNNDNQQLAHRCILEFPSPLPPTISNPELIDGFQVMVVNLRNVKIMIKVLDLDVVESRSGGGGRNCAPCAIILQPKKKKLNCRTG